MITDKTKHQLRDAFRNVYRNFVFDTVHSVQPNYGFHQYKANPVAKTGLDFGLEYKQVTPYDKVTFDEYNRCIRSEAYYGFTVTSSRGIVAHSGNYAEPNLEEGSFELVSRIRTVLPRPGNRKLKISPDRICGIVMNNVFVKWFICSEQFYRLWKLLLRNETHKYKRGNELRKWLMSGVRLQTNSYLKWVYSVYDYFEYLNGSGHIKNLVVHAQKRFWDIRSESVSKNFVHVYNALLLLMYYRELPDISNIPQNADNGFVMRRWDLPKNFVSKLLSVNTDCDTNGVDEFQEWMVEMDESRVYVGLPTKQGKKNLKKQLGELCPELLQIQ